MKTFGEKEAWAYPGTAKIFWVSPIISGREKLRISNLACIFRVSIRTKCHWKFWRKGSADVSRDCPIFSGTPIISGTAKAAIFKFCTHIYRLNRNNGPLKISGKVAVGIVRDSRKFSGHPYIWRIAQSSLRQLSFLVTCLHTQTFLEGKHKDKDWLRAKFSL